MYLLTVLCYNDKNKKGDDRMKKILSVLLSIILVFAIIPTGSFAANDDILNITVANDLHLDLESAKTEARKYLEVLRSSDNNFRYPEA